MKPRKSRCFCKNQSCKASVKFSGFPLYVGGGHYYSVMMIRSS